MAQLVIAAAGAAIGGYVAPGVVALGMTGASIGWTVGSLIGSMFGPTQKGQGPRLGDLRVSGSSYGAVAPWVAGTPRVAGQVIWASSKREIAHTESQGGKGGGGSEYTTFTYEVDLLILLSENPYSGISRVWLNGALVWNKSSTSSAATKAASDAYTGWTSITHYDGDIAQLPDPVYEAAVTTALAPAYRGRSCVLIEALQLGSGGQIPNLTFELDDAWDGDHAAGDGLTRLQVTFAGASSNDLSPFANGPGTNDEASVFDGYCRMLFDSNANPKSLLWNDVDIVLPSATAPLTAEFFFLATEISHSPGDAVKFAQLSFNSTGFDFVIPPYSGGQSYTKIRIVQSGFADVYCDTTVYGTMHHVALVNRSTGTDIYLDGVRVITARAPYWTGSQGTLQLGGVGRGDTQVDYYGCRVRYAEMYSGASFTPPSGVDAWGAP